MRVPIDEITAMPEAAYIALLVNLGKASGAKTGELIFNDHEKQSIAEKVCGALNEAISGGSFAVSEKTAACAAVIF